MRDALRRQLWRNGTSVRMQAHRLRLRFPFEEKNNLIFSFLRSGNNAKSYVDFRHSTRNVSRIRNSRKWKTEVPKWEQSALILCSLVPSTYPKMRETKER